MRSTSTSAATATAPLRSDHFDPIISSLHSFDHFDPINSI